MATLVARARAVVVSARADASRATFATGYRRATTPELDALCVKAIDVDGANAPASPAIKRLALGDRDASGLLSALRARDWALLEHTSARTSFASAPSAFVRKQTGPPGGALYRAHRFDDDADRIVVCVRVRASIERGETHRKRAARVEARGGARG